MNQDNKKDVSRKKSLGELGKLFAIKSLVDNEFDRIRSLKDEFSNSPFSIYAEKNNRKFVISVITRNKYKIDGSINSRYNLKKNTYETADSISKKYGAEPYWMAIQFDRVCYSVYFGPLDCLDKKNDIPVVKCEKGEVGDILIKEKKHYFDFDYFTNQTDNREDDE